VKRLALVAALAAVGLAAPAEAGKKPLVRARVQVVAQEYDFALSRRTIKAGPATVQLANFGEDAHDLRLKRLGGSKTYALGRVQPGDTADLRAKLAAGRYVLWCSIADHRQLGMEARLVVKKRRS
jgi:plastocyanin